MGNRVHIAVKPETKERLIHECVSEYLRHHPEMRHMIITHDKILNEIIEYYLEK